MQVGNECFAQKLGDIFFANRLFHEPVTQAGSIFCSKAMMEVRGSQVAIKQYGRRSAERSCNCDIRHDSCLLPTMCWSCQQNGMLFRVRVIPVETNICRQDSICLAISRIS